MSRDSELVAPPVRFLDDARIGRGGSAAGADPETRLYDTVYGGECNGPRITGAEAICSNGACQTGGFERYSLRNDQRLRDCDDWGERFDPAYTRYRRPGYGQHPYSRYYEPPGYGGYGAVPRIPPPYGDFDHYYGGYGRYGDWGRLYYDDYGHRDGHYRRNRGRYCPSPYDGHGGYGGYDRYDGYGGCGGQRGYGRYGSFNPFYGPSAGYGQYGFRGGLSQMLYSLPFMIGRDGECGSYSPFAFALRSGAGSFLGQLPYMIGRGGRHHYGYRGGSRRCR